MRIVVVFVTTIPEVCEDRVVVLGLERVRERREGLPELRTPHRGLELRRVLWSVVWLGRNEVR